VVDVLVEDDDPDGVPAEPDDIAVELPPVAVDVPVPVDEPPFAPLAELLFEPEAPLPPVRLRLRLLYAVLHCDTSFAWTLELLPEFDPVAVFDWLVDPCVEVGSFEFDVLCELLPSDWLFVVVEPGVPEVDDDPFEPSAIAVEPTMRASPATIAAASMLRLCKLTPLAFALIETNRADSVVTPPPCGRTAVKACRSDATRRRLSSDVAWRRGGF
jgi:hypothetical protein